VPGIRDASPEPDKRRERYGGDRNPRPDRGQAGEGPRPARAAEVGSGTVSWFAFQVSDTTYGIFDTFVDEDARIRHINGEIPKALAAAGDEILAKDPDINTIDIVAAK
jgi:quinol monooxygenase YgiN